MMKEYGVFIAFVVATICFCIGMLIGAAIREPNAYMRGQIDAIEGRIKYEQTGYVKIKG
jgi:ABC-type dipeptide/oligopeptide/nickel transport system permease subunit